MVELLLICETFLLSVKGWKYFHLLDSTSVPYVLFLISFQVQLIGQSNFGTLKPLS